MASSARPTGLLLGLLVLLVCCVAVIAWALLGGSRVPASAITAPASARLEAAPLWNASGALAGSRPALSSAGTGTGER